MADQKGPLSTRLPPRYRASLEREASDRGIGPATLARQWLMLHIETNALDGELLPPGARPLPVRRFQALCLALWHSIKTTMTKESEQ